MTDQVRPRADGRPWPRLRRIANAFLVASLAYMAGTAIWMVADMRRLSRFRVAMGDLRRISATLELHRISTGRFPCPGVQDAGACPEAAPTDGSPPGFFDPWGRPYLLLVTPDGANVIILSRGSDGVLDDVPSGPFMGDEQWRDLVMVNGSFEQFPTGYQCGPLPEFVTRGMVVRDRGVALEHWRSEQMRDVRALHAEAVARLEVAR